MPTKYDRTDFLEALFEEQYLRSGNFILVRKTKDLGRTGDVSYYPSIGSLGSAHFPDDTHVLFGVCPRAKMKPDVEHIRVVSCLWATLDAGPGCYSGDSRHFDNEEQMTEAVEGCPLKPSIIVHSGRGKHLYWLLEEVIEITKPQAMETLLSYFNTYFKCESKVGVDSTLRLPDTRNPRYKGPSGLCYVEYLNPDVRYSGTDLRRLNLGEGRVASKQDSNAETTKPGKQQLPHEAGAMDIARLQAKIPQEGRQFRTVESSDSVATQSAEMCDEVECLEILDEGDSTPVGLTDQDLEKLAEKLALLLRKQLAETLAESISAEVIERTAQGLAERLGLSGLGK
jgi:hypothetical protein